MKIYHQSWNETTKKCSGSWDTNRGFLYFFRTLTKAEDGGLSWQPTSFWNQKDAPAGKYTHADIHALVFIGYPYPTLYCASDGGIYSSFSGTNWTDISSGLEITQFYGISSPSHHALMIYGGAQDNGLNKWIFPGTTMDHQLGGDVIKCLVDYDFNDTVYALSPPSVDFQQLIPPICTSCTLSGETAIARS